MVALVATAAAAANRWRRLSSTTDTFVTILEGVFFGESFEAVVKSPAWRPDGLVTCHPLSLISSDKVFPKYFLWR